MKKFVIVQNSIRTTYLFRSAYIKKLINVGSVTVIAPNDDYFALGKLSDLGVNVKKVPPLGVSVSSKIISIFWINYHVFSMRKYNPVFICHFLVTFLMCFPSLIFFNKRCAVYVEGLGSLFSKDSIFRRMLRFIFRHSNITRLFCNQDERQALGYPDDIVTGGIGVDLVKFNNIDIEKKKNEQQYNLLYVGRLIEDKGVRDAIEVFRSLLNNGNNVTLTLVGDIYLSNPSSLSKCDIEELKNEFGGKIHFSGYSDNVVEWYRNSDVLLLPSFREGFPVCVMEASASGIPSFGYKVPGMSDAVKNNVNGRLVSFRDVNALSEAVEESLDQDTLRNIRLSSRCFALSNFCQEAKATDIVNILISL